MKEKTLLKYDWEFQKMPISEGVIPDTYREDAFRPVVIPHDWLIDQAENLYEDSVGWYKKKISIDFKAQRRYFLRFEGIYMDSTIFVNGAKAGEWKYGYTTFEVEITDYVFGGENEILVKVVHQSPNSRWYTGAGIYRPVWLVCREAAHFASDGIYIHTKKTEAGYDTEVSGEVVLPEGAFPGNYEVCYKIMDKEQPVAELCVPAENPKATLFVPEAKEWSPNAPYLYELKAELRFQGELMDTEEIRYGYRTLLFTSDKGFFLNGEHVKLQGVCLHHDLGCLGSAVNKSALRRQLALMQEMGANAIRTAHNMPSVELMELADEMGFLIVSESFDCWKKPKNPFDYARFFEEWAERDVANWIRRDRNHPSVIMWCIGNEIFDTHADERGQETLRMLMELVRAHDAKGNAPVTLGSNFMPWENTQKCADIIKLIGYNYAEKLYEEHHIKHPDWILYGSETSSIVQSRGVYHFPLSKEILADDDEQCSSLGNSITSWGAPSVEFCLTKDRDTEYSLGQFIWSGTDYIGEPTPYHGRNSYFGQADTAGFKKDSFYAYQAAWHDYQQKPVVHIFPYWDFNPGQKIDVRVVSNAPEVELFFNRVSLGRKKLLDEKRREWFGDWQLCYEPGELYAVAYDEAGEIIAEDIRTSFSDAVKICLEADRNKISANDEEMVFVTISMKDKNGNPVENANNRVEVKVSGAGMLAGLDNGDSTDTDQYRTDSRKLFNGKLLAVIRSNGAAGDITLSVTSEGMQEETLTIFAEGNQTEETLPNIYPQRESNREILVPVRKIELLPEGPVLLTEECRITKVRAVLYPENADAQELTWRVTDDAGVDSTFAFIKCNKENPREALIEVKGDGKFRVRCMCKNGKEKQDLISVLEYRAEGLGVRNLNPYEFLSASLFSATGGQIGNGNERGISTQRDGNSWVAYDNLDFGEFGSDEVEIPVFSFGGTTPFVFWEGIPYAEGSKIIGRKDYTLPSVWNTYIPDTFRLETRLRGITTFAVELDRKIHMKGFCFTKQKKALAKLYAAEADSLYGDSYERVENSIINIGNNVTLVFDNMDFGEQEVNHISICGKTSHAVNNIRLVTEWEDGSKEQESLEFPYSETERVVTFSVTPKRGRVKVSFVFLPGSHFDFSWFQMG